MEDIAIKVDGVTKLYGQNIAVQDLSFQVSNGEVHGFLGPNGAGKSTTMKMIAGLLQPSSGCTWVQGVNVQENQNHVKAKIGILLENPPLYTDMLVKDYLFYVSRLHRVDKSRLKKQVDETIEKLDLGELSFPVFGAINGLEFTC